MNDKTLHFKDIGDVFLVKNPRAKNVSIRLKPFEGVKVTIPVGCSFEDGEMFVIKKMGWIKKHLSTLQQIEKKNTIFTEETAFSTRYHALQLTPENRTNMQLSISKELVVIKYPNSRDIKEPEIQNFIRYGIIEAMRIEAKSHLPARVKAFAEKYELSVNTVSVKNIKSRWGSCSNRNNINLSLHLMRLPDYLVDYVILHELCHTVHRNHGKHFWKMLDKLSGNAKGLAKEMKNYRIQIY